MERCFECGEKENLIKRIAQDTEAVIYVCKDCLDGGEVEDICESCNSYFENGIYNRKHQLCFHCYQGSCAGAESAVEMGIERIMYEMDYTDQECDEIWEVYSKIPLEKFLDHDEIFLEFREVLEDEDMKFKEKIKEMKKSVKRYCC